MRENIEVINAFLIGSVHMRSTKVCHEYYANHLVKQTTHSITNFFFDVNNLLGCRDVAIMWAWFPE